MKQKTEISKYDEK